MDTFSTYYIKKYNTLAEEIKRLQYENKLLEDISAGTMVGRPDQTSGSFGGSSISTTSGSGVSQPPQPTPFNADINNDNVVDGADLGAFLANWNNPYGGAELGNLLAYWDNPSNPSEPEDPEDPEDPGQPGQPSNPTNPQDPRGFYPGDNVRGTSTKDIATLRRNIIF